MAAFPNQGNSMHDYLNKLFTMLDFFKGQQITWLS